MDIQNLSIDTIRKSLIAKKFSALDLTKTYLARLKKIDPKIKAFITITDNLALKTATSLDQKIAAGKKIGKLAGSLMAIKDNFMTEGTRSTAGSQVLKDYIPPYSSTLYNKLLAEDSIPIGKTNTDAFTFGASTENSGFFITKNPWNLNLVPGGSSGGSAAALSANLCTFALGTDTGGSIRQPASLCSVTGIKPTYGRNSRFGITSMASSFDTPGAFAKTAADLALVSQVMAGVDCRDATSSLLPVPDYPKLLLQTKLKGLKIGLAHQYFADPINPAVKKAVQQSATVFEKQGAKLVDISLPNSRLALAVYYILVPCEISANMARFDGIRFGSSVKDTKDLLSHYLETRGKYMEDELKRRILIGTYALSAGYFDAYYMKAAKVRTLIKNEFINAYKKVDLILAPTSPTPAWPIGQKVDDPLQMYLADIYTCPVNVAGLPALALPCGFTADNLPVGFQLIGNYWTEDSLFSAGYQYQQLTDYHLSNPKL
jgi:aspartyl-tRNA(Asn)/glutamyl-tRNA(Gln) amidotransferase subunit A